MRKNQLFFQKNHWLSAILLTGFFAMLALVSCKDKKKGEADSRTGDTAFKMNCVILTKAQVQIWVDSGWTNPANANRIKQLLFQFYSAEAPNVTHNLQLMTYPGSGLRSIRVMGKTIMSIDTTCAAKIFSGAVVFANNTYAFDNLKITNPDGTLNDFDFIRLRPVQKYPPYINFDVEIVRLGVTELAKGDGTDPCPPYCPDPPPPEE